MQPIEVLTKPFTQRNTDKNSNDMKDKLTQISDDLNHNLINEKEAREQLLILCGVVRSTRKHADTSLQFNCPMCKTYYENNLNLGKVANRCCPTCASVLPSI